MAAASTVGNVPVVKHRPPTRAVTTIVIVGAGQAGAQAAFTLREQQFTGRIVLLGNEPQAPYQRPPLSKKFLANALSVERLLLRPASFYPDNGIDLRLHVQVDGIDRKRARLYLHGGAPLAYDRLLLATGSRPRMLAVPGSRCPDVHYLRNLQDAMSLRSKLGAGRRLAIVGGGYIGLEVAAIARTAGIEVGVFEAQARVLNRVTTTTVSSFIADAHRKHGVEIVCSANVTGFESGERLDALIVNGARMRFDVAVVGVGAVPNDELARGAGLECDNGIVVDEHCATNDPHIFAAGDCTNHPNPILGKRLRLESVQNAVDQGRCASQNMIGSVQRYAEVPWFWSNQYHHKIQSAGLFEGHDEVEQRGTLADDRFALLYRRQGCLIGIDAVNSPRDYMEARKALTQQGARSRKLDDAPGSQHLQGLAA